MKPNLLPLQRDMFMVEQELNQYAVMPNQTVAEEKTQHLLELSIAALHYKLTHIFEASK